MAAVVVVSVVNSRSKVVEAVTAKGIKVAVAVEVEGTEGAVVGGEEEGIGEASTDFLLLFVFLRGVIGIGWGLCIVWRFMCTIPRFGIPSYCLLASTARLILLILLPMNPKHRFSKGTAV